MRTIFNILKWLGFGFTFGWAIFWGQHLAIQIIAGLVFILFIPQMVEAKLNDNYKGVHEEEDEP